MTGFRPPTGDEWDFPFYSCDWGNCDNQASGLAWDDQDGRWLPCCESCGYRSGNWVRNEEINNPGGSKPTTRKVVAMIYVASRSELGPMWRQLQNDGHPINSTWIHESGPGETSDISDLWMRCIREASEADVLIAYHRPGDVWKGALVEIGAALAHGRPIYVVGDPPGSWVNHPNVTRAPDVASALEAIEEVAQQP